MILKKKKRKKIQKNKVINEKYWKPEKKIPKIKRKEDTKWERK